MTSQVHTSSRPNRREFLKRVSIITASTVIVGPALAIGSVGVQKNSERSTVGWGMVLSYPAPSDSALFLQHYYQN